MKKNEILSLLKYAGSILANQFIAILVAFFVNNMIAFFAPNGLMLLRFLVPFIVYLVLLYTLSWSRGSSDANRIKLSMLYNNKFRGFIAGFIAALPSFVFAVLAFMSESGSASFFEFLGVDGVTAINRFINMPLGNLYVFANENPALNLVFPFFIPVLSGIAYILGINGISLRQILIYKADKE